MFDMVQCGRTISLARKKQNMTQMELADRMGISFQAVSNWERGVSMPDISKLLELSEVLGITVDEILGKPSPLVETLAAENAVQFVAEKNIPMETEPLHEQTGEEIITEVQTLPEQLNDLPKMLGGLGKMINAQVQEALAHTKNIRRDVLKSLPKITLEEFKEAAPLMKPAQVDRVVETSELDFDLEEIEDLLPFLGKETCGKLFRKAAKEEDMDAMEMLAPFVDRACIDEELIRLAKAGECVEDLVHCASKEACAQIGWELYQSDGIEAVEELLPFMPKELLEKIALDAVKEEGSEAVEELLPFLSKETAARLAEIAVREEGIEVLENLAPFLPKETLQRLARESVEKYGIGSISDLAPYLGKDFLVKLVQDKFK